jgi:hypothetical protein
LLSPLQEIHKTHPFHLRTSFVYVSEAHAEDEWPVGNRFRTDVESPLWTAPLNASKTVTERAMRVVDAANRFQLMSVPRIQLFADHVERQQSFEKLVGGWPTGFYVLEHGPGATLRLMYNVTPKHGMFVLDDMWNAIRKRLTSQQ